MQVQVCVYVWCVCVCGVLVLVLSVCVCALGPIHPCLSMVRSFLCCSGRNDEFQLRVEASCIVLATLLKSWSGLMCLAASPNGSVQSALTSVVEVLPLVGVNTQVSRRVCVCAFVCACRIMHVFVSCVNCVMCLNSPEWLGKSDMIEVRSHQKINNFEILSCQLCEDAL